MSRSSCLDALSRAVLPERDREAADEEFARDYYQK